MRTKNGFGLLALSLVAFSNLGLPENRRPSQTSSSVVRASICGNRLGTSFGPYYDKKQGYYLLGDVDGLGKPMIASLILCPDFKPLKSYGARRDEITQKTLPLLREGKGVNIGDSPYQVRQKIGQPPHETRYNRISKIRTYIYGGKIDLKVDGEMQSGWDYTATYTFHREKLWSIEYHAEMHIPEGYDEMGNRLPEDEDW